MALTVNRPLDVGLALHLRMSEGVGVKTLDVSKYQNHGNITGATWVSGKYGRGLGFDGNDFVQVPDAASLRIYDAITVAAWVNLDALDVGWHQRIVQQTEPALNIGGFGLQEHGSVFQFWVYLTGGIGWKSSQYGAVAGVWKHVVGTYDGDTIRIYVDTIPGTPFAVSSTINIPAVPTNFIGKAFDNAYLEGVIDDVRIYNRALSAEEVKLLYAIRALV